MCWVSHAAEVSYVLVGEIMLLTVIGLPLGWLAGYGFAALSAQSLSSEIVNIPLVVSKSTFGWATVLVFVSALVSVLIVRRRLDRVDLASALKQEGVAPCPGYALPSSRWRPFAAGRPADLGVLGPSRFPSISAVVEARPDGGDGFRQWRDADTRHLPWLTAPIAGTHDSFAGRGG